ncbi:squalene/phytoene synthase family protein [Lysinibacillus odysseyi]|uniref:Phytoene synthase n=1 Tax=Lysinibacillus odysseyi 34hs-1 = NBRC 100172 TaxID=1220589 RepID=A0A0A3IE41_9BACI|nr:squalene/phytoene synthase family protein [Lysinibacillus odysseyi]KGR81715.1 phytoene synthase [Lysinibacillus odysseyi 34hs-1 = NBRC 100172]
MNEKALQKDAMRVLKETSRTFYIPITFLGTNLKYAVGCAYLCMRALDEIEDNEEVDNQIKHDILMKVKDLFHYPFNEKAYLEALGEEKEKMPEVTLRMKDWIEVCPADARNIMFEACEEMAYGMGKWAQKDFNVQTREDLDEYTYYVAGLVGRMLSQMFEWDTGLKTDHDLAIGYGRGLQAVNILRNEKEDMEERGVSFVPDGWTRDDLFTYADEQLAHGNAYIESTRSKKKVFMFAKLPYMLANKTLAVMKEGREKISRFEVEQLVEEVKAEEGVE